MDNALSLQEKSLCLCKWLIFWNSTSVVRFPTGVCTWTALVHFLHYWHLISSSDWWHHVTVCWWCIALLCNSNSIWLPFLEVHIDNLCAWTNDNLLMFNAWSSPGRDSLIGLCHLLWWKTPVWSRLRYLGVWLTSSLSWSSQVTDICKSARRQLGYLYRKFYHQANSSTLLQLYLAPWICCSCVGSPSTRSHYIFWKSTEVCTQSMHKRLECWLWYLTGDMKSAYFDQRHYLKLSLVSNYLFFMMHPSRQNLLRNLRNSSSYLLQRLTTRTNAHLFSLFPHTISLECSPSVSA